MMCLPSQDRLQYNRAFGAPGSYQPLFLCNMHGQDIVKLCQVKEDTIIAPDSVSYLEDSFDFPEWKSEKEAYGEVSTRDERQGEGDEEGAGRGQEIE
jgi:hypothetical protein